MKVCLLLKTAVGGTPLIKGEATFTGHEGWLNAESVQLGRPHGVVSPTGQSIDDSGGLQITDIVVTRYQDSASPSLYHQTFDGTGFTLCVDFLREMSSGFVTYLDFTCTRTLISSYQVSGRAAGKDPRAMESMTFNFAKINFATHPIGTAGKTALIQKLVADASRMA